MRKRKQMSKLQKKSLNKILQNHAGWLWGEGLYTKSMECLVQARPENDKRDKKGRKNIVRGKNGQFLKGGKHDRSNEMGNRSSSSKK